MEPGVEARIREAVAALEAAGATVEEVSLPHTDYGLATYYIVAPAEASANLARYDGIRYGPRLGDGDVLANYLATRGQGLRRRGQAADHARDLRAVGRLLRRLLPEGAEGADPHQGRFRRPLGPGLRRPRRADLADRRVPARRPAGRSGLDVPLGRLHPAGQHGRPARRIDPVRTLGRAAGRAAADRGAMVGGRAVRPGARLRGDHRGRRLARARTDRARRGGRARHADAGRADGRADRPRPSRTDSRRPTRTFGRHWPSRRRWPPAQPDGRR